MTLVAENCYVRATDGALLRFEHRDAGPGARGVVVTLHGLGEHVGKYEEWFDALLAAGYHVYAYDQRGHGRTPGRRGDYAFGDLVADLERFLAVVGDRHAGAPLLVVAHSLGALVALRWAREAGEEAPVAGIVLSSPPLELAEPPPAWFRWGVRALAAIAPRLPLPRRTDPSRLTRDPERVAAIESDPLAHRAMTPRAMTTTAAAMEELREAPPPRGIPMLILAAGEDRVADSSTTLAWARSAEDGRMTVGRVPGAYHELLNDLGREATFRQILEWCGERVG